MRYEQAARVLPLRQERPDASEKRTVDPAQVGAETPAAAPILTPTVNRRPGSAASRCGARRAEWTNAPVNAWGGCDVAACQTLLEAQCLVQILADA